MMHIKTYLRTDTTTLQREGSGRRSENNAETLTQNLTRDANQIGQVLIIINPSLIERVHIIAANICLSTTQNNNTCKVLSNKSSNIKKYYKYTYIIYIYTILYVSQT